MGHVEGPQVPEGGVRALGREESSLAEESPEVVEVDGEISTLWPSLLALQGCKIKITFK